MSSNWWSYKSSNSSASEENLREARRKKLEQERLFRHQQRADRKKQLQAAIKSREEADQALKDLYNIAPDIFDGTDSESVLIENVDELLDLSDNMAEFDTINGTDSATAMENLKSVQCPFELSDIEYWFTEFELQLTLIDVQSQWLKRLALQRFLPPEIRQEVKTLFKLSKADAGNDIYKKCKTELIELFGAKQEDCYIRAKNRVMTGKPSQLGKALMDDLCKKSRKLDGCCCADIIWGMYREQLPITVRNHIAELSFNKDTYKQVFTTSDKVHASNQSTQPVRATTLAAVSHQPAQNSAAEVAAVTGARNKNQRNNKGGGGGAQKPNNTANPQTQTQPKTQPETKPNKGTRHATAKGADDKLCRIHFKWGINGSYCAAPWKCPMKDIFKAPQ